MNKEKEIQIDSQPLHLKINQSSSYEERQSQSSDIPSSLRDKISSNQDFDFFIQNEEINGSNRINNEENILIQETFFDKIPENDAMEKLKR